MNYIYILISLFIILVASFKYPKWYLVIPYCLILGYWAFVTHYGIWLGFGVNYRIYYALVACSLAPLALAKFNLKFLVIPIILNLTMVGLLYLLPAYFSGGIPLSNWGVFSIPLLAGVRVGWLCWKN